ncbi:MAG TPA: hypothetical protein VG273_01265 [Bryobacteraceae bacterium]|jgi:6-phospho-beta-glucosidase|nr:hypothetical protein [Bryobacteraceae bacterium]
MKISVLGCGLRTPLLLHGLIHADLGIAHIALYDNDSAQSRLMAQLGAELAAGATVRIEAVAAVEETIKDSAFVISSIRVGNMETRAADERIALECGFAGQETTGPAGFAMALRTIPVALEYARIVLQVAPEAWIVNFTNPAGIVTQAISSQTKAKVVGICDTPAELFHQIARALGEPPENVRCDYFGLNHLGWVRSVRVRGSDVTDKLLEEGHLLRRLYPADLFDPAFIRTLRLIPTEYLFFYYNHLRARDNQLRAGVTRGEELNILNRQVLERLQSGIEAGDPTGTLDAYKRYLNRRNASYMRLDGEAQSAFAVADPDWDPFLGATGYHRIAVEAIRGLTNVRSGSMVLNVPNRGSIEGLHPEDIVEVPCTVDRSGALPLACGPPPDSVKGLLMSVKHFERMTIEAAVRQRWDLAAFALSLNPIVASWEASRRFLERLAEADRGCFSNFT